MEIDDGAAILDRPLKSLKLTIGLSLSSAWHFEDRSKDHGLSW